jgi:hypothetical protein
MQQKQGCVNEPMDAFNVVMTSSGTQAFNVSKVDNRCLLYATVTSAALMHHDLCRRPGFSLEPEVLEVDLVPAFAQAMQNAVGREVARLQVRHTICC